jgi:hypothetical protein
MRRLALVLVPLALGPAAEAAAQVPAPAEPAAAEPQRFSIHALSGIPLEGRNYVAKGQRVRVRGKAPLAFAGRQVAVRVRGRQGRTTLPATLAAGPDAARFDVTFTAKRAGTYTVSATEADGGAPIAAKRIAVESTRWRAGKGASGTRVRVLQRALRNLGFVTSANGRYDEATARGVLAFRKTNFMARTGFASRTVYSKLLRGEGGFKLKYPDAGKHVEADLSRQVIVLARGSRPERIYHTSSGTSATPTIQGSFRFYMKQPGVNSKRMLHSNYFIRGYAIHGYPSVPNGPASHGCLRIPNANAKAVDSWIKLGDRIFVYR